MYTRPPREAAQTNKMADDDDFLWDSIAATTTKRTAPAKKAIKRAAGSTLNEAASPHRTGRWTLDEKILFLYGLRKYGRGRWKKISVFLPHRSLVQIKSHAQKVLKRLDGGESEEALFRRLDEHHDRVQMLLRQLPPNVTRDASTSNNARSMTRQNAQPLPRLSHEEQAVWDRCNRAPPLPPACNGTRPRSQSGVEHILAASALCQLGADGGAGDTPASANPSLASSPASWEVHSYVGDEGNSPRKELQQGGPVVVVVPPPQPQSPVMHQDEDDRQVVSP